MKVRGLTCTVGSFTLGPLELELPEGAYLCVVGPSGHGKTTLLWSLAGALPCSGSIQLGEVALHELPSYVRRAALVPQGGLLFPHLSVAANISFGLRGDARVSELAQQWGCEGLLDRKVSGLSGGEKMRVALARALATEPQLLLLDEPLSGLEPASRAALRQQLKGLRGGRTIVHVTHDLQEASALSTHLALLQEGKLVAFGPTSELLAAPSGPEMVRWLGPGAIPGA